MRYTHTHTHTHTTRLSLCLRSSIARRNERTASSTHTNKQSPRARARRVGPHRCRRRLRRRLVYHRRDHHLTLTNAFESSNAIRRRRREDDIEHRCTSWERSRRKAGGRSEKEGDARSVFSMEDIHGRCENVERAFVVFSISSSSSSSSSSSYFGCC